MEPDAAAIEQTLAPLRNDPRYDARDTVDAASRVWKSFAGIDKTLELVLWTLVAGVALFAVYVAYRMAYPPAGSHLVKRAVATSLLLAALVFVDIYTAG